MSPGQMPCPISIIRNPASRFPLAFSHFHFDPSSLTQQHRHCLLVIVLQLGPTVTDRDTPLFLSSSSSAPAVTRGMESAAMLPETIAQPKITTQPTMCTICFQKDRVSHRAVPHAICPTIRSPNRPSRPNGNGFSRYYPHTVGESIIQPFKQQLQLQGSASSTTQQLSMFASSAPIDVSTPYDQGPCRDP